MRKLSLAAAEWPDNPALSLCSLAAKGLWMDLLWWMHRYGEPYGHLSTEALGAKSPVDEKGLCRLLGTAPAATRDALAELERRGVFSRTGDGIIFSRELCKVVVPSPRVHGLTEIPEDFEVTPMMRGWAEERLPSLDIDAATEEFRDYWAAKGQRRKDWVATWRNGMRRLNEWGRFQRNQSSLPLTPVV